MRGSKCLIAIAGIGLAGVWAGCERHDWNQSTSALYRHHGGHDGHGEGAGQGGHGERGDQGHHGPGAHRQPESSQPAHNPAAAPAHPATAPGQPKAEAEGGARRVFPH